MNTVICDNKDIVLETAWKAMVGLVWAASHAAKWYGDILSWCGEKGLEATDPRRHPGKKS